MPIYLCIVWLLFSIITDLSSCDTVYGPQSLKYLPCDPLQKTLTDPCSELSSFWDSGWPRGYHIGWGCSFWEMKSVAHHSQALKALSLAKVTRMATLKSKGRNPSTCLRGKPETLWRQNHWLTHGYGSQFREFLSKYFFFIEINLYSIKCSNIKCISLDLCVYPWTHHPDQDTEHLASQ